MIVVGLKKLTRTPVPKLPSSYPPSPPPPSPESSYVVAAEVVRL